VKKRTIWVVVLILLVLAGSVVGEETFGNRPLKDVIKSKIVSSMHKGYEDLGVTGFKNREQLIKVVVLPATFQKFLRLNPSSDPNELARTYRYKIVSISSRQSLPPSTVAMLVNEYLEDKHTFNSLNTDSFKKWHKKKVATDKKAKAEEKGEEKKEEKKEEKTVDEEKKEEPKKETKETDLSKSNQPSKPVEDMSEYNQAVFGKKNPTKKEIEDFQKSYIGSFCPNNICNAGIPCIGKMSGSQCVPDGDIGSGTKDAIKMYAGIVEENTKIAEDMEEKAEAEAAVIKEQGNWDSAEIAADDLVVIGTVLEKYGDKKGDYSENKDFVDDLHDVGVLTDDEYNDIIGKGWFNTEEDMDFVKKLLEKKLATVKEKKTKFDEAVELKKKELIENKGTTKPATEGDDSKEVKEEETPSVPDWSGDKEIKGLPGAGDLSVENGQLVLDCGVFCKDRPLIIDEVTGDIKGWGGSRYFTVYDEDFKGVPNVKAKQELLAKQKAIRNKYAKQQAEIKLKNLANQPKTETPTEETKPEVQTIKDKNPGDKTALEMVQNNLGLKDLKINDQKNPPSGLPTKVIISGKSAELKWDGTKWDYVDASNKHVVIGKGAQKIQFVKPEKKEPKAPVETKEVKGYKVAVWKSPGHKANDKNLHAVLDDKGNILGFVDGASKGVTGQIVYDQDGSQIGQFGEGNLVQYDGGKSLPNARIGKLGTHEGYFIGKPGERKFVVTEGDNQGKTIEEQKGGMWKIQDVKVPVNPILKDPNDPTSNSDYRAGILADLGTKGLVISGDTENPHKVTHSNLNSDELTALAELGINTGNVAKLEVADVGAPNTKNVIFVDLTTGKQVADYDYTRKEVTKPLSTNSIYTQALKAHKTTFDTKYVWSPGKSDKIGKYEYARTETVGVWKSTDNQYYDNEGYETDSTGTQYKVEGKWVDKATAEKDKADKSSQFEKWQEQGKTVTTPTAPKEVTETVEIPTEKKDEPKAEEEKGSKEWSGDKDFGGFQLDIDGNNLVMDCGSVFSCNDQSLRVNPTSGNVEGWTEDGWKTIPEDVWQIVPDVEAKKKLEKQKQVVWGQIGRTKDTITEPSSSYNFATKELVVEGKVYREQADGSWEEKNDCTFLWDWCKDKKVDSETADKLKTAKEKALSTTTTPSIPGGAAPFSPPLELNVPVGNKQMTFKQAQMTAADQQACPSCKIKYYDETSGTTIYLDETGKSVAFKEKDDTTITNSPGATVGPAVATALVQQQADYDQQPLTLTPQEQLKAIEAEVGQVQQALADGRLTNGGAGDQMAALAAKAQAVAGKMVVAQPSEEILNSASVGSTITVDEQTLTKKEVEVDGQKVTKWVDGTGKEVTDLEGATNLRDKEAKKVLEQANKITEDADTVKWQGDWLQDMIGDDFYGIAVQGDWAGGDIVGGLSGLMGQVSKYRALSNLIMPETTAAWMEVANNEVLTKWADLPGTVTTALCNMDERMRYSAPGKSTTFVKTLTGTYQFVGSIQAERTYYEEYILCEVSEDEEDEGELVCREDGLICIDDQYCYLDEDENGKPDKNPDPFEEDYEPAKGYFYKITWAVTAPQDEKNTPYVNEDGTAVKFNVELVSSSGETKWIFKRPGGYGTSVLELNNGAQDSGVIVRFLKEDYQEVCIRFDDDFYVKDMAGDDVKNICAEFIQSSGGYVDYSDSDKTPSVPSTSNNVQTDI
jgi:hypothetical protein